MKLLQKHKTEKEKRISEFTLIEWGLTFGAVVITLTSLAQPKNPANALRLPAAFVMFGASCLVERLRESDLLSHDRATEYEKNVKSERIQLDTVMHEELHKLEKIEDFFARIPIDRHAEMAQKLGVQPPNYAARQTDTLLQSQPQNAAIATESKLPDPTGDFDPESESESSNSGMMLIPAERVQQWFEQMGELCPESLRREWAETPGKFIEINDGTARILR